MQEHFIDTPEKLQQLCRDLSGSDWLALDTEFIRERTYFPRFCLLQLCNGEQAACIDPIALPDLSPLQALLYDQHITKVFHAGRQDLEIFHHLWHELPQPLFDTQVAASLLGSGDQIGYANLVREMLDIELNKGASRTDWSLRPLEPEQLRYALDDVIHLGEIYLQQRASLEKLQRLAWLDEDFNTLADPATYRIDPQAIWQRVRGRQQLRGVQLAVLQQLASWREQRALSSDKPRKWILKDDLLLELARHMPEDLQQLSRLRGIDDKLLERRGQILLDQIKQARAIPAETWPAEKHPQRPGIEQEALADLLMCALRLQAHTLKISPSMLASRKELQQLACGKRDLPLLRGWRKKVAGSLLLELVEGRSRIEISNGKPVLKRA